MIVYRLDYQVPSAAVSTFPLVDGLPPQWSGYDPDTPPERGQPTGGVTLGTPGFLPAGYTQAARFDPPKDPTLGDKTNMRPRSQGKLNKGAVPDAAYLSATGTTASQYGSTLWGDAAEGLERWYGWKMMFPAAFSIPSTWEKWAPTIFMFEHGDSKLGLGVPCIQFHVRRWPTPSDDMHLMLQIVGGREEKMPQKLNANGVRVDDPSNPPTWAEGDDNSHWVQTRREHFVETGPLQLDYWYDFMAYIKYSGDPAQGRMKVWCNGVQTIDSATTRNEKLDNVVRGVSSPPNGGANLFISNGVTHKLFLGQGIYEPRGGPNTIGYDIAKHNPYNDVLWGCGMIVATTQQDLLDAGFGTGGSGGGGGGGGGGTPGIVRGAQFVETWTLTGARVGTILHGPEFTETWDLGAQYGLHDVTVYRRQNGVLKQLFGSKRTGGVLHGVTPTQFIDVGDDQ